MKRTVATLALAVILAGTSHAAISGKKPAFMDKQQLAAMRAEASSKAIKETEDSAFFTGKPYLAPSDEYAFKYRSYSPGIARWTSEDPSGFPDGANASYYAPTPSSELDFMGLWKIILTSVTNSYSDNSGLLSDLGILTETTYTLAYSMSATTTSVEAHAYEIANTRDRFTGTAIGSTRSAGGQGDVTIGLTSEGYLTANVPSGSATSNNDVSGGVAITGTGFTGNSRTGSITVSVNAAYEGVVNYTTNTGALTYTPGPDNISRNTTRTFTYEVVE